jgi:hypothetical protein
MRFVSRLSFDQVFDDVWAKNEEHMAKWQELAKARGFADWREWRSAFADALELRKVEGWELQEVTDPFLEIPKWYGGPFRLWIEQVYGFRPTQQFEAIAKTEFVQTHTGIADILRYFPAETTVIALQTLAGIIVIEGMHRCSAIALAAQRGLAAEISTKVYVAIAPYPVEMLPHFIRLILLPRSPVEYERWKALQQK